MGDKRKDKPEKPPKIKRRDSDWWCNRCKRVLFNNGQDLKDTVTGIERTSTAPDGAVQVRVRFKHDECGGSTSPGR